jgi:Fe-S cluster assembly iron-binding protein IscA
MLTVTERAKETLARLKATAENGNGADAGLRLLFGTGPTEFGLQLDREKPGDQVVEHAGAKVLLVDEALADALADATIDVERGDGEPGDAEPGDAASGDGVGDLVITRPRSRAARNELT